MHFSFLHTVSRLLRCTLVLGLCLQISACHSRRSLAETTNQPWDTIQCGARLQVISPVSLVADLNIPAQYPQEVKAFLNHVDYYVGMTADARLQIFTNTMEYKPEIACSLDGAAASAVESMSKAAHISDFTFTEKALVKDSHAGKLQQGSWKERKTGYRFMQLIATEGNILWQVTVQYAADDESGTELAQKIIDGCTLLYTREKTPLHKQR